MRGRNKLLVDACCLAISGSLSDGCVHRRFPRGFRQVADKGRGRYRAKRGGRGAEIAPFSFEASLGRLSKNRVGFPSTSSSVTKPLFPLARYARRPILQPQHNREIACRSGARARLACPGSPINSTDTWKKHQGARRPSRHLRTGV
ncbi:hypothetical protein BU26DRAFT_321346 [Trematosphaeria pertusa]|uniref:Uncharacterized protein n=1 Tax=Trematosphaeria pertusa TaxID=390896 RepID=A0A6A6IB67_9PLEO|nr:uncharacterized protein BU26DRAFT_321346 [Trematosphaeria pertusa]KAF2247815.1 hypothetical protein BU26DRAFT_321346 [Trematosphaeria pertusa]